MFGELIVVFTFVYGLVLVNNLFLIRPFLLYQKKYNLFFIGFTLLWSFFLVVAKITHYIMGETISIFNDIMGIIMISLIGSGIYFIHQWILQNIFKTQIKLLNTEAELSLLKQQMNPHFLLNAMNNLYGDALMAPETLPDKILKLSELLRYQIEATKKDFISLSEEMHFIEQYLGYHTYRSHNLSVKEEHNGSGNDLKVPPLFFMPLVENAVKFTLETARPDIRISWTFRKNHMTFYITNNYNEDGSVSGTGTGIENLKRRLEVSMIRHTLTLQKENGIFNSELKLWNLPLNALS